MNNWQLWLAEPHLAIYINLNSLLVEVKKHPGVCGRTLIDGESAGKQNLPDLLKSTVKITRQIKGKTANTQ